MRASTGLITLGATLLACSAAAGVTGLGSPAPADAPFRLSADSARRILTTEAEPRPLAAYPGYPGSPGSPDYVDPAAFGQAGLIAARALSTAAGSKPWQQVGAGGAIVELPEVGGSYDGRLRITGVVLDLAVDPRDPKGDTAILGTGGGVWKTTDGGAGWTQATGIPAGSVGGVGISPVDSKDVYAVSGQAFQSGDPGGSGVYVSHDGGRSFTRPASNVSGAGGQHVEVGPDGVVFVATSGGLFRSTDQGATFADVLLPTNAAATAPATNTPVGSWTSDVRVRPHTSGEVYAAVGYVAGNVKQPDGTDAAPGNGLYRSTANGAPGSWKRVSGADSATTGWRANPGASTDPIGRTELAFSADGSVLWALVADAKRRAGGVEGDAAVPAGLAGNVPVHPDSLNGLYRSDATLGSLGDSWVLKATSASLTAAVGSTQPALSALNAASFNAGIQAWYNGFIAVDPTDANRIIVGEEEPYQSLDANTPAPGLATFQSIDPYLGACLITEPQVPCSTTGTFVTHPDQHGVGFAPLPGSSRLWIGNDGGVFRQDAGPVGFRQGAWTSGAYYNTLLPYRAVKSTVGGKSLVSAGLQDNGTVLWRNGSKDAFPICGGDGSIAAQSPTNLDVLYCNANGTLYVSTDGGASITNISPSGVRPAFQPASFALDPANEKHLVTGATVIDESALGAETTSTDWKTVFTFPLSKAGKQPELTAVDVLGSAVYASACFFSECASSVKGSAASLDRMIATNVKPGCTPATGTAACWHKVGLRGFPNREIMSLAIDPRDVNTVYAATSIPSVIRFDLGGTERLLVSHDAGESFSDASGDLPQGNAWDVKVAGGTLYVATDSGVFQSPTSGALAGRWQHAGTGLPETRVMGLSLSSDRAELVAATYGSGVWTTALPGGAAPLPQGIRQSTRPQKPVKKPVRKPTPPTGSLAATGLSGALGAGGALALTAGLVLARRSRRST